MDISELAKQAPYLAAIVIIVFAFLRAQKERDTAFLQAQTERDKLYLQTQTDRDKIFLEAQNAFANSVISLSAQVGQMENTLIKHDASMSQTARNLEKSHRAKTRK